MALNPIRDALGRQGIQAFHNDSSFKKETDAFLSRFQGVREGLERQVRQGDITLKVARQRAASVATEMKNDLLKRSEGFSPTPRVFMDRLVEASDHRKRSRENQSIEGLQRETNRLLRQNLIEQQLQTRVAEFEGRTFVRPMSGGQLAPTLDSLLNFHETSKRGGDEAGAEWSRRQLEGMRNRVFETSDLRRIDLACDRPDQVNPRLVASYMESLKGGDFESLERFATAAVEERDANACVAAFLLARQAPEGSAARWVRDVLTGVSVFPDSALNTLRGMEAEARESESQAARAQVEYAAALADSQAGFSGVEAPDDETVSRLDRLKSKPVAKLGEPIGLALDRRGEDLYAPSIEEPI